MNLTKTQELFQKFKEAQAFAEKNLKGKQLSNNWKLPGDFQDKIRSFIGQDHAKTAIEISIAASLKNKRPPNHMLFHGPPGFGKTRMAEMVSRVLEVPVQTYSGKTISQLSEIQKIVAFIQQSEPFGIVFIDEVHRINVAIGEELYNMMQNFMRHDEEIKPFMLIAATTDPGMLLKPFRDRFIYKLKFDSYSNDELKRILKLQDEKLSDDVCDFLVSRCKGTPRILLDYFVQAKNVSEIDDEPHPDLHHCNFAMYLAGVDDDGLTQDDMTLLRFLRERNKPIGGSVISLALNIPESDLVEVIEPYLLQKNLINRTPSGREITTEGRKLLSSKGL